MRSDHIDLKLRLARTISRGVLRCGHRVVRRLQAFNVPVSHRYITASRRIQRTREEEDRLGMGKLVPGKICG